MRKPLPEPLFKTSGKGGTHTKVCALFLEKGAPTENYDSQVFMADAKWYGHDSRGNITARKNSDGTETILDDVPTIAERYHKLVRKQTETIQDHLGFLLPTAALQNRILAPKYYDPDLNAHLQWLVSTHTLAKIGELVERGLLQITTGVEVGKMAYGTGPIPFIRTSDISNWELKADPQTGREQRNF